ncbi:MAG: hypothetical protein Q9186_005336 [Xanthomendoza sp. 1 TL-2023]
MSGSSATSVMVGSRGNGTAVKTPESPVMVLFTVHEDKYAFLHFELTNRISVNPERCYCRQNSKKACQRVVLETTDKAFDLRRFEAAQTSAKGLYTWDLARFRLPRHPQYKDVEVVKKVEYLTLDFDTVEEKDEFRKELVLLEKVRKIEMQMYQDILSERRNRDRRPARR